MEPDGLPSMGSQSRTRLKRLSSSSSSYLAKLFLDFWSAETTSLFFSFSFLLKWAPLIAQLVKNASAMQETLDQFLGWEDLLEKG